MTLRELIHALIELGTDDDALMAEQVRVDDGPSVRIAGVDVIGGFPYLRIT